MIDRLTTTAAIPEVRKQIMRILRDPNLSVKKPLGRVRIVEHKGGIAAMIPSCCNVRPNSTRKTGKSAGWILVNTWVKVCVKAITSSP